MSTDTLANQQTGGTAKPADSAAAAAAALAWPDLPRDDPVNQSANSLRQILNAYRQELQGETAENDATRQFNQDLTDLEREYNGISTIVAQYLATYPRLTGTMKPVARTQRDEVQSWCNDEDEVPANLAAAIRALWATYQTKEPQTIAARDAAKNQFNALKSPLDAARSLEADALAALEWLKAFAGRATDYFSQLANLHREARGYLELRNYRQVYAVFLVIDSVWTQIRSLDEAIRTTPMRDSAWLSQALNQALRAVIARKRLRYLRHREWLQRERAANDAIADYTRLIENHNLRMEFIREAQDVITP